MAAEAQATRAERAAAALRFDARGLDPRLLA